MKIYIFWQVKKFLDFIEPHIETITIEVFNLLWLNI